VSKKLSIITVVYNGEKYIESAIKSVLHQKTSEIEYIIVDGLSTDETMKIVNKYQDQIDIIVSESDQGIYDAMNKGVRHASGEYVVFLNSDDYYNDGLIRSCLEQIYYNPDVVITNTLIKSEKEEKLFKRIEYKEKYKLYLQIPFMHPSVVIKRTIFNELGGFDLNYKIASDCDFLLKMISKVNVFCYINDCVVMRVGGISDSSFKQGRKEYRVIYSKFSGSKLKAWKGYFESMLFYRLHKMMQVVK